MNRRKFLTYAGAGASLAVPGVARAEVQCTRFNYNGIQMCEAGVRINQLFTARQECENWCWAACIQTIFNYAGYDVPQTDIVKRLFGDLRCARAQSYDIMNVIDGYWQDDYGNRFRARPMPLMDLTMGVWNPNAGANVANALSAGVPLICGALGHATVLTSMTYYRDVYTRGIVNSITVRDPWPFRPNKRLLTPQEAAGTFFIAGIQIS